MRALASFLPLVLLAAAFSSSPAAAASAASAAFSGGHGSAASAADAEPVTVARYSFDTGTTTGGRVADLSGRGPALSLRSVSGGQINFNGTTADRYAAFPAVCTTTSCGRALLEGPDDPDLDPLTRPFRWGASVRVTRAQISGGSANIVQKGVADTDSQWKLQVGARQGKAQCVVVGQGGTKPTIHVVRSTTAVADGAWHDIMCHRNGPTLTIFIDGQDRGHTTIPATVSIANALPLRVGGPNFSAGADMYHGLLDDVYARLG